MLLFESRLGEEEWKIPMEGGRLEGWKDERVTPNLSPFPLSNLDFFDLSQFDLEGR